MSEPEVRKELLKDKVFDYDYGDLAEKMKPGHEVHDNLVKYGIDVATRGYAAMTPCHKLWRESDWKCTGYVTPEEADPRNNPKDKKRNVITPMTFRIEEMYLAAHHDIFMQDPIFRWKPLPGADSLVNAAITEYMVQRHALWFDLGLHMDDIARDAFRYGIGMGQVNWAVDRAKRPKRYDVDGDLMALAEAQGVKIPRHLRNQIVRDLEEQVVCEGSEVQPWDPYASFYDTTITPNHFKRGTNKGTLWSCDPIWLLQHEREHKGQWFNGWYAKVLAEGGAGRSQFNKKQSTGRDSTFGITATSGTEQTNKFFSELDVLYIPMTIIPKDWGVGDKTYPCKYFLAIAADEIIVGFGELDYAHGGDGTFIMAPNADGHTFVPVSHLLVVHGLAEHTDNIFRCTTASLRKNINGGLTIFNHNILNWDDYIANDEPGKVIRPVVPALTKEMMEAAILNVPHVDKSPEHMQHIFQVMQMASEGVGAQEIGEAGEIAGAERPTKAGVMAGVSATGRRFKRLAYRIGAQAWTPVGWMFAYNLVQFGKQRQQIELRGRLAERFGREIGMDAEAISRIVNEQGGVDPRDIDINFEMEPYTGAMPQVADMQGLSEIIKTGMAIPEIAAEMIHGLPLKMLLKTYLRKNGFDNIDDYPTEEVTTQVAPDEQVQEQVQAGNLVPIGQMRSA